MASASAITRVLGLRSVRLLCNRTLTNPLQRSLRSGSIFAATTRAASQKPSWHGPSACSRTCSCGLHKYTQADSELMNFLGKEIQIEASDSNNVPTSKLFQANVEGTQVNLERDYNGEKIVVSFDLNHNVNHDEGFYSDTEEKDIPEGKIVSYPYFEVKITKKTGQTLKFDCEFTNMESVEPDSEEGGETSEPEMFSFVSVSVMDSPDADKSKSIYEAETENMDRAFYSMLSNMLADRGVDTEFAEWLLNYSTSLEHRHYIKFLENLKSFITKQ